MLLLAICCAVISKRDVLALRWQSDEVFHFYSIHIGFLLEKNQQDAHPFYS